MSEKMSINQEERMNWIKIVFNMFGNRDDDEYVDECTNFVYDNIRTTRINRIMKIIPFNEHLSWVYPIFNKE